MIQRKILLIGDDLFNIVNFIEKHTEKYKDDKIIVYTSNQYYNSNKYVTWITGDLYNKQLISYIINQYKINTIINCNPTNINNIQELLDCVNESIYYMQLSSTNIYEPKFMDDNVDADKSVINEKMQDIDLLHLACCDLFAINHCIKNNIKYNIVRCCNSYGKYEDKYLKLVIDNLKSLKYYEMQKEECLYDWVSYKKIYEAIDLILNKKVNNGIIDISSGVLLSKVDIAGLICTAYRQISGDNSLKIKLMGNKTVTSLKYTTNASIIKELGWIPPAKNSIYTDILSIISFYI